MVLVSRPDGLSLDLGLETKGVKSTSCSRELFKSLVNHNVRITSCLNLESENTGIEAGSKYTWRVAASSDPSPGSNFLSRFVEVRNFHMAAPYSQKFASICWAVPIQCHEGKEIGRDKNNLIIYVEEGK